jgi:glycosyltransferase involved in cell wall biosynthesis
MMILSWDHARPVVEETHGRRTVCFRIRAPWSQSGGIRQLFKFIATLPLTLARLRRVLRQERITAVNFHFPSTCAIVFPILRLIGLYRGKIILSFHNTDIWLAGQTSGFERALWKMILRNVDSCVGVSHDVRNQILELCRTCNAVTVHNGLDFPQFLAERDPNFHLRRQLLETRYILNVASFTVQKGQDTLIEAFAAVSRRHPDLLLVLIGKTGPFLVEIQRAVDRFGLGGKVLYLENVPHSHVGEYFERATLFVLPSRREGFPIVLLEAGFYALPIITTNIGGSSEAISHQHTGRLVPPDDPAALATEMLDLLEHPNEAKRLGLAHRQTVEECFSWKRAYESYLDLALEP